MTPASARAPVQADQRAMHDAYMTHSAGCWAQGDTRKCDECRQTSRDAEAEDDRRIAGRGRR